MTEISEEKLSRSTQQNTAKPNQCKRKLREKIDDVKYVYELVNGWIANADAKVEVSCVVFTLVFGVVSGLTNLDCDELAKMPTIALVHGLLTGLGVICLVVSVVLYVLAIKPRMNSENVGKDCKYPLFFGDIAKMDCETFRRKMLYSKDSALLYELIQETRINSGICCKKMKCYHLALCFSTASIIIVAIDFIVMLLCKVTI